ncbi:formyltetrahydrofolate deformylase [Sphingobacterium pedocola]|uniref:Formyltetrahydrofolate deformylase n=1 Tax=Sphingobacterium pedocola TaxID=2082722 RepID=A0ABR9T4E7_9SPHI|nr:formyltetrahydrofolate deformylase [Sphingobacterium pedocola]MBE8720225.1 formyltetrahydrofolate deformylase [Sphingobacterium pedocola]
MQNQTLILIQCKDAVGLVASISNVVAKHELNIITMREYVDEESNKFFVRVVCSGILRSEETLMQDLMLQLPKNSTISVSPAQRKKIVVLVTKEHHCLADILIRHYFNTLQAEVLAVVGNYETLKEFTEKFDIPYHHLSHENISKEEFENKLAEVLNSYPADYIILAKFMRILSPCFVKQFKGKLINIHHSFLPAFIGANPYKQAHERGVKIIGATAHFVTDDLDEGPIIVQNTKTIDHSYDLHRMRTAGKEIEKAVLSRAIQLLTEDRVMLNGNKTIVFKS